jgi:hypothetical protein
VKILLDECLPLDFRHSFPDDDAHTAQWAGLKGKKNGELLQAAEAPDPPRSFLDEFAQPSQCVVPTLRNHVQIAAGVLKTFQVQ